MVEPGHGPAPCGSGRRNIPDRPTNIPYFHRNMSENILGQIADGRTDLVFDYLAGGHEATSADKDGVSLLQWCSYHGDVSAIKFLLANGESLQSLAELYVLNTAA